MELLEPEKFKPKFKALDNGFKESLNESLIKTIEILREQLQQKDTQIKDLNERLKEALKLNENQQILLKQEQEKAPLLTSDKQGQRRRWFTKRKE